MWRRWCRWGRGRRGRGRVTSWWTWRWPAWAATANGAAGPPPGDDAVAWDRRDGPDTGGWLDRDQGVEVRRRVLASTARLGNGTGPRDRRDPSGDSPHH